MNKIYYDEKTNLEWQVGLDKDTTWDEAKGWIDSLGDSWRMPTIEEYKTIYKAGLGKRNIPPELETTGWYGWSDKEEDDGYAWLFHFNFGKEFWVSRYSSLFSRGFAVRYRGLFDNFNISKDNKYEKLAVEVAKIVKDKNEKYGDSYNDVPKILEFMYPNGIPITSYSDAMFVVRILDKLKRIATKNDKDGENPFKDITGYGLLALSQQEEKGDN